MHIVIQRWPAVLISKHGKYIFILSLIIETIISAEDLYSF